MVRTMRVILSKIVFIVLTANLVACDPPPPPVETKTFNLVIQTVDPTNNGIPGIKAVIRQKRDSGMFLLSNDQTSDDQGTIQSNDLSADWPLQIELVHADYATQVSVLEVPNNGDDVHVTAIMLKRVSAGQFDSSQGGKVAGVDGAIADIPVDAFVDANGNTVSGNIDVTITPVDVSSDQGRATFPGSFSGINEDGSEAPLIVSFGTAEYRFTQNGNALQLKAGTNATIEIPIYVHTLPDGTAIKAGDTIPLWYLNESTGEWHNEGTGTVVANANTPTGFALRGSVAHFTWWNVDIVPDMARMTVTVNLNDPSVSLTPEQIANLQARIVGNAVGFATVDTYIPVNTTSDPLRIPANTQFCVHAVLGTTSGLSTNLSSSPYCFTATPNSTTPVTLTITIQALSLNFTGPNTVTLGTPLGACGTAARLSALNAIGSTNFSMLSGSFHPGITLSPQTGLVFGTTSTALGGTNPAVRNVQVQVQDSLGRTAATTIGFTAYDLLSLQANGSWPVLEVGTPYTLDNLFNATGGRAPLAFSLSATGNLPNGMVLENTSGSISGTPAARIVNNQALVDYQADVQLNLRDANCALAVAGAPLTVVYPPQIGGTPEASISAGNSFSFVPQQSGGPVESWTAANLPAWMSLNSTTGELSGTPDNNQAGDYTGITLTGHNGIGSANTGYSSSITFDITVVATAKLPQVQLVFADPSPVIKYDTQANFTNLLSGGSGSGALSFTSLNTSAATVNATTGEVTLVGEGNTTITATKAGDAVYEQASASYNVVVRPSAITLSYPTGITATPDFAMQITPTVTGYEVTWSIDPAVGAGSNYTWLNFDTTTGVLSGTPPSTANGQTPSFTVTAGNPYGGSASATLSFTVDTIAPSLSGTPPATVEIGIGFLPFSFTPTNNGGPAVGWSIITDPVDSLPAWMSFNTANGTLSGLATQAQIGTSVTFSIRADNGAGFDQIGPFTVDFVQAGPALDNSIINVQLPPGRSFDYFPIVSGGAIDSYSIDPPVGVGSAHEWLSFDTNSGNLYGWATINDIGSVLFTITATNSIGTTTASITIEVVPQLLGVYWHYSPSNHGIHIAISDFETQATTYQVYYATEPGVTPANYASLAGGGTHSVDLVNNLGEIHISGLVNGQTYYLIAEASSSGGGKAVSEEVAITASPMNDSGQYRWGTNTEGLFPSPIATFPGQDADVGLDQTYDRDNINNSSFWLQSVIFSVDTGAGLVDDRCVRDQISGLLWEEKLPQISTDERSFYKSFTYAEALAHVDAMNAANNGAGICGRTDWRLPNYWEMHNILSYSSYLLTFNRAPFGYPTNSFFLNNNAYLTGDEIDVAMVWAAAIGGGQMVQAPKAVNSSNAYNVLAVSGTAMVSSYTDNQDGTVTDTTTGLVWKKCLEGESYDINTNSCGGTSGTYTWQDSLQQAVTVNADITLNLGSSDWRVPNIKELHATVDISSTATTRWFAPLAGTTNTPSLWSATPMPYIGVFGTWAYTTDFASGKTLPADNTNSAKTLSKPIRLVRGGVSPRLWYRDDDGDQYGVASDSQWSILKPAGYVPINYDGNGVIGFDCNDIKTNTSDPNSGEYIFPGQWEDPTDGIDNNCNGIIDEHNDLSIE